MRVCSKIIVLTLFVWVVIATEMRTLSVPLPVHAAGPWYVGPGGNDGNTCLSPGTRCATINGALNKPGFVAGDTIRVAIGTYTGTGTAVVLLNKNATLSGGWNSGFTTQNGRSTIDGQGARRGIEVNDGVTAMIDRFVIQHGFADHFTSGGGIYNSGILTLKDCTVSDNGSTGGGGGVYNVGSLTLNNSDVSNNASSDSGGGLVNLGTLILSNSTIINNESSHSLGGGIYNTSTGALSLSNSTVSGNTATSGGGIYNSGGIVTLNGSTLNGNNAYYSGGGGIENSGILTLTNSIASGNSARTGGGGIENSDLGILTLNSSSVNDNGTEGGGGGVDNFGILTSNNSTISGNSADNLSGGVYNNGAAFFNSSTISGNTAVVNGGGIRNLGSLTLQNSILAGNTGGSGPDCNGVINTLGYNLIGNTSNCTFSPSTGDLSNVDARLGLLVGSPGYHSLLSSSPAINAGNPAGCTDNSGNPLTTDQRGASRVGRCDIGAYEYQLPGSATSISAISGTPQRTAPFSAFAISLQTVVLDNLGSPVNNAMVTFSAPSSGPSGIFADSSSSTTSAATEESGVATAATFTANGLAGNYTVTATVSGVATTTNFLLSNILRWYVSPGGNDANVCLNPNTACATINGVLQKADFIAGDTVFVATGTYIGTGNEVVSLNKDVILSGGWNTDFTTQSGTSTVDGKKTRRGITVNSGVTAVIELFTVQNGSSDQGGGILNIGNLTLSSSKVSSNITSAFDGGGGIDNDGVLTLNNSTINDNVSAYYAGGISNDGAMTLNNSAVIFNRANSKGGGGIINVSLSTMILNNTTVSGNVASERGGGIINGGALTLNNSTVSGNIASNGGGIEFNSGVVLQNTILAGNIANTAPDCSSTAGSSTSSGYNIIGNTTGCPFNPTTGDLINIDAKLGPLEGSQGYHPLLPGSPAINAGNPADCTDHLGNSLTTDQRGMPRVGQCDIGAYEFDSLVGPITSVFLPVIIRN